MADDLRCHYLGDALGPWRKGRVLLAEGNANLTGDGVGLRLPLVGAVALVVVDRPGEGGDGHDQAAERARTGCGRGWPVTWCQASSRAGMPSWRVSRIREDGPVPVSGLGNSSNKVTHRTFHARASEDRT